MGEKREPKTESQTTKANPYGMTKKKQKAKTKASAGFFPIRLRSGSE
jgi:hypothetical protein